MKFAYHQYLTHPSPTCPTGVLYRPEIPLRIVANAGSCSLDAMVDPGSDDTLLPLAVARAIGVTMDATQIWHAEGIGGQSVPIILGEVVFELSDGAQTFRWNAKVGLVDFADPGDEVTLVGHAGFLDYFRVIFDGQQRTLELDVTSTFAGQIL